MVNINKWVICLNEDTPLFNIYAKLIRVAVTSCIQNTDLTPIFIYDGKPNELTRWLIKKNVKIINHQSLFLDILNSVNYDNTKLAIARGAFLRIDIPVIAKKNNWDDSYIFYTDCDVMFTENWNQEFNLIKCKYFSVAPEIDIKNFNDFNTGAMIMNIKNLYEVKDDFNQFIVRNIEECLSQAFDQTAYQIFFSESFDRLDPVYNWKTYWGKNSNAKLIHFHGLKPHHRSAISEGELKEPFKSLLHNDFQYFTDCWDKFLNDSNL